MVFDDFVYNDPNKSDIDRDQLRDYSLFNRKVNNAIATEKKSHAAWTAISGIASSFIPFGLGAFITPGANALVQARKKQQLDKVNAMRAKLGIQQETEIPSSGLDLGGVGYGLGTAIQKGIPKSNDDNTGFKMPTMTGDNSLYTPTAPEQYETTQQLNLPKSDYWSNSGGGVTGLLATTQNGYLQGPPTAEMRNGGKIDGPTHEQGGIDLVKNGKRMGITVEGNERVVNKDDWKMLQSLLGKKDSKGALSLLKAIDKRKPETENAKGANLNKFDGSQLVDYGYNGARLGLGLEGAFTSLPQYQLPKAWSEAVDKSKYFSEQGLTPEEQAIATNQGNTNYQAAVRDLANASGGNAAAYLANLGTINAGRNNAANDLALKDALLKRQNFGDYKNTLQSDIAYKKQIFDQQYNQALANKQSGVTLASDAISDIQNRMDYDKFYGKGSYYDKMQQALLDKGMSDAEVSKEIAKYWSDPTHFRAAVAHYQNQPPATTVAPVATSTTNANANPAMDIYLKPAVDAVTKILGNSTTKDLTPAQWFDAIEALKTDANGGRRLTTEIYDMLEKAGYKEPKGIH